MEVLAKGLELDEVGHHRSRIDVGCHNLFRFEDGELAVLGANEPLKPLVVFAGVQPGYGAANL